MKNNTAVFIISVGRSGTHLLSQVLDGSPEINFPMEQAFVLQTYRRLYNRSLTPAAKEYFKDIIKKDLFLTQFWKLDHEALFKYIDHLPANTPYHELCESVVNHRRSVYTSKENAGIMGLHNPRLTFHVENMMEIFPGSKFIFLHRNALDTISSFKSSKFFKGTVSIPFFAYRWKWYNTHALALCRKHPERFYRLSYEDLVNDPEEKIRGVCSFLNTAYNVNMLKFEEKFSPFYKENVLSDRYHMHAKLTEQINNKSINSYEKNLDNEAIELSGYITNKIGEQLGYEGRPTKFRIKFLFAFWVAVYYSYKFDYYALLQFMINRILPGGKMIRF